MRLTTGAILVLVTYVGLTAWGLFALCDLHPWTAFHEEEYGIDPDQRATRCSLTDGFRIYLRDPDTQLPFQCAHWPH